MVNTRRSCGSRACQSVDFAEIRDLPKSGDFSYYTFGECLRKMRGDTRSAAGRMSGLQRWLFVSAAMAVLALMVLAARLEPSKAGYGTHEQLGLPPCASITIFGRRCLACGMTTSWSLVTRLRMAEAYEANAGGFLLAIIALAYVPLTCYFCFQGRFSRHGWLSLSLAISLIVALGVSMCQWVIRCAVGL